jgi:tetratricopeptide (TPR) repeat protein
MAKPLQDRYGLQLSTSSAEAAELYGASIDIMLALNAGAQENLDAAIAHDEDFALAHIALARWFQYAGEMAQAQVSKRRALECLDGVTRRERQHVTALAKAVDGDGPGALALIYGHLQEFPRDAFVLKQADGPFGLLGFGGGQDHLEENFALLDGVAHAYGEDWWFLSAYAFSHNELGRFAEAERLAERALELNARSGHSAHTRAHVFFEMGRPESGSAFLEEWLADYPRASQIYSHLTWHLALFELASGHVDRVQALYDDTLRPDVSPGVPLITLCDAASLVWRHRLYGVDCRAEAPAEVAALARETFSRPGITFADVHCALAYAAAGEQAALERLVEQLEERLSAGKIAAGEVVPILVKAVAAFAQGNYEQAADLMEPIADWVVRVGGSNAQRSIFEDTLLHTYLRSGRHASAAALLRQRLARRPSAQDETWLQQAQG